MVVQTEASEPGRVYPAMRQLAGAPLCATDGECGTVRTLLIDPARWTVASLVARTGGALTGGLVLVPAVHLGRFDWAFAAGAIRVDLPRETILASPRFEAEYAGPCLRADDLPGWAVATSDQDAHGVVDDVLVDDVAWAIRFLQVDVGDRNVLVPTAWIDRLDRAARTVRLVVGRAQLRASPAFAGKASPGPNLG